MWSLQSLVHDVVWNKPVHTKTLVLGCGNSNMTQSLVADGFDVESVDISSFAIEDMERKQPESTWRHMDARDMWQYPSGQFDLVIEKGMLDGLPLADNLAHVSATLVRFECVF